MVCVFDVEAAIVAERSIKYVVASHSGITNYSRGTDVRVLCDFVAGHYVARLGIGVHIHRLTTENVG